VHLIDHCAISVRRTAKRNCMALLETRPPVFDRDSYRILVKHLIA